MMSKILCLVTLIAIVAAQHGHHHHEGHSEQYLKRHDGHPHEVKLEVVDKHGHHHHVIDYYAYPHYEYGYKVEDKHTGDIKSQHETRDGDVVKGHYELHDPHGNIRKVEYESDKRTGFHASVHQHGIKHVYGGHH